MGFDVSPFSGGLTANLTALGLDVSPADFFLGLGGGCETTPLGL